MPLILKTRPFAATSGDTVTILEKPYYGGRGIGRGDEVFVWFSETQGGDGLAWQGRVSAHSPGDNGRLEVSLVLNNRAQGAVLGKAELEPLRDCRDGAPLSEIARKLYRQAHNKIASLTDEEGDLLRGYFRR